MDKKIRNIIYIAITIICILAIGIAVYSQFFAKKVVNVNTTNIEVENIIEDEEEKDDPKDTLAEFNGLFSNTFYKQKYSVEDITKIDGLEDQNIIYTAYNIKEDKDGQYSIDIKLPVVNIDSEVATKFNETTQQIFADKASNILAGTTKYTVYSVEYVSYLNDKILSVVIKSTLKEGNNPQRVIVQTYNYDIENDKEIALSEVLKAQGIEAKTVNKKIDEQVTEASKQAATIAEATGQIIYKRDLSNAMYTVDNARNFFVGKEGQIYIVYAYGNNNATSEIDIIKI